MRASRALCVVIERVRAPAQYAGPRGERAGEAEERVTAMGSQASVRACTFAMSCMCAVCADRGGVRAQKSVETLINDAGNPGGPKASNSGQADSNFQLIGAAGRVQKGLRRRALDKQRRLSGATGTPLRCHWSTALLEVI